MLNQRFGNVLLRHRKKFELYASGRFGAKPFCQIFGTWSTPTPLLNSKLFRKGSLWNQIRQNPIKKNIKLKIIFNGGEDGNVISSFGTLQPPLHCYMPGLWFSRHNWSFQSLPTLLPEQWEMNWVNWRSPPCIIIILLYFFPILYMAHIEQQQCCTWPSSMVARRSVELLIPNNFTNSAWVSQTPALIGLSRLV